MIIAVILFFIALLLCYIFFLLGIHRGLRRLKLQKITGYLPEEYVSVIIPFRNESENILRNLQSIAQQDLPVEKYEVIYVNDSSDDDSFEKICNAAKPDNVRIISVAKNLSICGHKKKALKFAIEQAKGEIIVTTDCDCTYNSNWLSTLLKSYDKNTGFVSGPVAYFNDDTLFTKLQKLEFAGLILTGAGLIGSGKPTISNAANLSFRKEIFKEVGGFDDTLNLSSGDDELLMQKIAKYTSYDIKFCWNKNALVLTTSNNSISDFFQQRKRWASKGLFYFDKLLMLKLIIIFSFYLGLLLQALLGIVLSPLFFVSLIISLIIKGWVEFSILLNGKEFLFTKNLMKYFIIAELFHVPYIVIAAIAGAFGNFTWKERKIKR
ncbi:MAG: glycosyltransferase [Ignavibacteriales bacterium]|nr:glycosyltransferase [Ignavibacteriales bacterium]